MKSSKDYLDYVLIGPLHYVEGITSRPMFGGFGIYKDGIFFALIDSDQLYFKADESTEKDYKDLGSQQFTYEMKGKSNTMDYWSVPEEIMSDPDGSRTWALKAFEVAKKAKEKKKKK